MATGRVLRGLLAALLAGCSAFAPQVPDADAELRAAIGAARRASTGGPAEIGLADRTLLELDAGFAFVPPAEGARLLRALGRRARENLLGVVVAGPHDAAEVAALYSLHAAERDPAPAQIAMDGWRNTPALAGFRIRR